MDVAAINFHNFRQHTYRIPLHGTPDYTPEARTELLTQLMADYHAVRMGVFPHADHAPQQTAQRLADGATAAAVRMGIADHQGAINEAAAWLSRLGWITTPATSECYGEAWKRDYAEQGGRLTEYMACRQQLLTMLSLAGQDIPTTIHQRFAVAFRTILTSDIPAPNVEELQLMVAEAMQPESSEVASSGHAELVVDVTLGELESRLVAWERAKEAPRPGGARGGSVTDYLNRGYAAALASQCVAESQAAAATCVPGYSELHTLSIHLFRDDLNARTCKMFRHALVDDGLSASEARWVTIADVLARLHPVRAGASGGCEAKPIPSRKRRPGRRKAKEANPERYKTDLKFYQDWESSGLTQREFIRERGVDSEEGMKSLGRGKHYAKKSGINSAA